MDDSMESIKRQLADETAEFFSENMKIGEAPISMLAELYQAPEEPQMDDIYEHGEEAGEDEDDEAGSSLSSRRLIKKKKNGEEFDFDKELFLEAITLNDLKLFRSLLERWKETEDSVDFWILLNINVRFGPDEINGKRQNKRRKSSRRRSSVRLSMKAGGDMDVPSKTLVSILDAFVSRADEDRDSFDSEMPREEREKLIESINMGFAAAECYLALLMLPGIDAHVHVVNSVALHRISVFIRDQIVGIALSSSLGQPGDESHLVETGCGVSEGFNLEEAKMILSAGKSLLNLTCSFFDSVDLGSNFLEILKQFLIALISLSQVKIHAGEFSEKLPEIMAEFRDETYQCMRALLLISPTSHTSELLGNRDLCALSELLLRESSSILCLNHFFDLSDSFNKKLASEAESLCNFISTFLQEYPGDEQASPMNSAYILAQQITVNVQDKSEFRTFASKILTNLVRGMDLETVHRFMDWLSGLLNGFKTQWRSCACDFSTFLLTSDERLSNQSILIDQQIELLIQASTDKAPAVRAKALESLNRILEMASINPDGYLNHFRHHLFQTSEQLPGSGNFVKLLRRRCTDEKATVRRSAILLLKFCLKTLICMENIESDEEAHSLFKNFLNLMTTEGFSDPLLSIRKLVIKSLSELIQISPNLSDLWSKWKQVTFASLSDAEQAVHDEAISCFKTLVLDKLASENNEISLHGSDSTTFLHQFILQLDDSGRAALEPLRQLISSSCLNQSTRQNTSNSRAQSDQKQIWTHRMIEFCLEGEADDLMTGNSSKNAGMGAWMILSCFIKHSYASFKWPQFVEYFKQRCELDELESAGTIYLAEIIRVLISGLPGKGSKKISSQQSIELMQMINSKLVKFEVPLVSIGPLIEICQAVSTGKNSIWIEDLVEACKVIIENQSNLPDLSMSKEEANFSEAFNYESAPQRAIYTLSEIALLAPSATNEKIVEDLLIVMVEEDNAHKLDSSHADVSGISSLASSTHPLKPQAISCLGKMCLVNQSLAKRFLPVFARELSLVDYNSRNPTHVAVRMNCVAALGDLARRYPRISEPFIDQLSEALLDPEPTIRLQSLVQITRLLQHDYLKFRPTYMFKIVQLLVDPESMGIVQMARECILCLMRTKQASVIGQNFADLVMILNGWPSGAGGFSLYNTSETENSQKQWYLYRHTVGKVNRHRRRLIYKFLLTNLMITLKFTVATRLCDEVLISMADQVGKLFSGVDMSNNSTKKNETMLPSVDERAEQVLLDCLQILSGEDDWQMREIVIDWNLIFDDNVDEASNSVERETDDNEDSKEETSVSKRFINSDIIQKIRPHLTLQVLLPTLVRIKRSLEKWRMSWLCSRVQALLVAGASHTGKNEKENKNDKFNMAMLKESIMSKDTKKQSTPSPKQLMVWELLTNSTL